MAHRRNKPTGHHLYTSDFGTSQRGVVMIAVMMLLIVIAWPISHLLANATFVQKEHIFWQARMEQYLLEHPLEI